MFVTSTSRLIFKIAGECDDLGMLLENAILNRVGVEKILHFFQMSYKRDRSVCLLNKIRGIVTRTSLLY